MFLRVISCSVMELVLTSTCVLCAGLFSPSARAAGAHGLTLQPPYPVNSEDQERFETSYLHLPMFLHFRKPRVDKRHFSPSHVKSRKLIPKRVRQVLLPEPRRHTKSRVRPSGPMSVSCDSKEMRVRVDATNLEPGMHVTLGTCEVSKKTERSVLFRYELHECDTRRQMLNETVVYSNMLHYTPHPHPPSGFTPEPFSVPVQCHFNRFHYVYKIGFVPSVERVKFLKPIKTKVRVSLAVCDAQWNRLASSDPVLIGRPVRFEAEALYVPEDQRLFLSFCHVTANNSHVSMPQVNIIDNYGCLMDSKRSSSSSSFINSSRRNVVRFIMDAFRLQGDKQKFLFIHCEMSIGSIIPTETSKMCTYNQLETRWVELNGADAVCLCCDSFCVPEMPTMTQPLTSELQSLAEQNVEQQKNTEELSSPKHEVIMTKNLLTTHNPVKLLASNEYGTRSPEAPPTLESQHGKMLPVAPPTPAVQTTLTLEHRSGTLIPNYVMMTAETPPMLEWEKYTPHTHPAVTPSAQQNTHTVPHEPYRIFEEVFGLG